MRRSLRFFILCSMISAGVAAAQEQGPRKIWVGVLPVADASGEPQSEVFGQFLTATIFRDLQSTAVEPILLSPGGTYNPLSSEWITEFGHRVGVDVVVISSMLPSDKPKKGDWTLKVEAHLMDITTGKTSPQALSTYRIDRRKIIGDPWRGDGLSDSPRDYLHEGSNTGTHMLYDERPFEKQPLGKAAKNMAESIRDQVLAAAPSIATSNSAPFPPPTVTDAPCGGTFEVSYPKEKKSAAYDFIINNRNESLGMFDGVAKFSLNPGSIIVRVVVHDAPYRLPVQHLYQASGYLDCSATGSHLILLIGPDGEAVLRWQ